MPFSLVPTGGVNVPSVLTPGNSQLAMIQGGVQSTDSATGFAYAPAVVQLVDKAGVNGAVVDSSGNQLVKVAAGTAVMGHVILDANTVATYAASVTGLVPAASATDIFTLTGSASKTIRIMRVAISATTTSATPVTNDVVFLLRSTANSAGTATQPTVVPYDSADAAGSAVVNAYTANPTTGNLVGNIYAAKLTPTLATYTATDFPTQAPLVVQFGITDSKPVVLRGVAQVFAINLNAASMTGTASVDISIEWTEQ